MDNRLIFLSRLVTFDDGVTQKDTRVGWWTSRLATTSWFP